MGAAAGRVNVRPVALVGLTIILALVIWNGSFWFVDLDTYRGAAQRLLDGHDLYALSEGDLPVRIHPPYWSSPLLYPPTIAVLWVPFRFAEFAFIAACMAGVLWTTWTAAAMVSAGGYVLLIVLAPAIAVQLAGGNFNGLVMPALMIAWLHRERSWIGIPLGLVAGVKLAPVVMILWLVGQGRYRAAVLMGGAAACLTLAALVVTGPAPFVTWATQFLSQPSTSGKSLSEVSGITWLTPFVLTTFAAGALLIRRDRTAFACAVAAMTFGTPLLFVSTLALLVPAVAVVSAADLSDGRIASAS